MPKTTISVTIDGDLKEHFNRLNINLSGLINDYLRSYKNNEGQNVHALNEQIVRQELEVLTKKHQENEAKMRKMALELQKFEENKQKIELDRLKTEKKKQDELTRCRLCGAIIKGPVTVKGKDQYLCLDCASTI